MLKPLGSSLRKLILSGNRLGGSIPGVVLAKDFALEHLHLTQMDLHGELDYALVSLIDRGLVVILSENLPGFTLPIEETAACFNRIDLANASLHGHVPRAFFASLCRCEAFNLRGNAGLSQSALPGWLACNTKSLKNSSHIHAQDRGIQGDVQRHCSYTPRSHARARARPHRPAAG